MLDTALQITAEQGVANVTMAAIATLMGVTRPVVYACYNGRSEVLTQLLERETRLALASLRAILPPQRTGSVEQMFVDGFGALLGDVAARPASWQIIAAAQADPVLAEAITQGREQIRAQIGEVMQPLLQRWQVRDLDVVLPPLIDILLSISDGAIRMMLRPEPKWAAADLAEIVGRAAYRALRASPH
ncbi:TetR/AcrR family transcriptional regulator [Mycobacterium sp. CBMA271]|uniref:TetR/AcrR family transcriptional regulator n=1 Tax=unclassified Mycobacteroides TaxID=2618759 RepID=UPI0013212D4B|nr:MULTISPECIES: TetR/AcrR family transcriptional regulator [unclassified Mycobacteroides]MUM18356.1 transcriptional regulator [Mycobacteroides sp. CBMA 326]MUM23626.1 TetR/AcrR family transcriptional regulator [Mycobacteroides sp. CBMA 271]